ncbi:MAG TPA: DUF2147 domain-containing protein [Pseudorhodoplanes sp.]|nr:DUF2147 domain-containing protein [Pseudorhodoplanes sp.]
MRKLCLVIVLVACICGGEALAAEPIGEWLVANGDARIKIEPCPNGLWGVISWTREPGVDVKNPDPAKRERPMVGVPILRAMKPVSPDKWEGEVYNAQNGKMYSANIALVSDDVLKIQGCVLGGIFCGGENWTRVVPAVQPAPAPPQRPGVRPAAPTAAQQKAAAAAAEAACASYQ